MSGDNLFNFWWGIPETGFLWTSSLDKPGRYLTTGLPTENHERTRNYQPFDEPRLSGIFKTFAELEPSEAGVHAFASRFGCVLDPTKQDVVRVRAAAGDSFFAYGESLSLWGAEIARMQAAVTLWEAAEGGNEALIRQRMVIQPAEAQVNPPDQDSQPAPRQEREAFYRDGAETGPTMFLDVEAERLLEPFSWERLARLYVQYLANESLKKHVFPRVLYNPTEDRWDLRLRPQNLLGGMWLQLARAVAGKKQYRSCPECGTWFEIDRKVNRTSRLHCSNACRSKAYRERQAEAQRLSAEGLSVDEIARRLDSDAATVAGWLSRP